MDLYVYSDESGVFDQANQNHFVFGGVIFLSSREKELACRRYQSVEENIRMRRPEFRDGQEIKASNVGRKEKGSIYRSMNPWLKFGVVMHLKRLNPCIFSNKRSKQRYMDYAYKIGLKYVLAELIRKKTIDPKNVRQIHVYCDEHSTATNGLYEMREALLSEFKYGTFNYTYDCFFEPLFPNVINVEVDFCSSASTTLVRPADIVANHIYNAVRRGDNANEQGRNLYVKYLP